MPASMIVTWPPPSRRYELTMLWSAMRWIPAAIFIEPPGTNAILGRLAKVATIQFALFVPEANPWAVPESCQKRRYAQPRAAPRPDPRQGLSPGRLCGHERVRGHEAAVESSESDCRTDDQISPYVKSASRSSDYVTSVQCGSAGAVASSCSSAAVSASAIAMLRPRTSSSARA